MNECVKLHLDNDYVMKIVKHKIDNQITVTIPNNDIKKLPCLKKSYLLNDCKLTVNQNGKIKSYHGPNYSLRPMVLADVLLKIDDYDFETSLVMYYRDNERVDLANGILTLLEPNTKDEENFIVKEVGLITIITKIFQGETDVDKIAEKLGIQEGVEVLTLLLEGEFDNAKSVR